MKFAIWIPFVVMGLSATPKLLAEDAPCSLLRFDHVDWGRVESEEAKAIYELAKKPGTTPPPEEHEINQPRAIVSDSDGNVYVADPVNLRIVKFSPRGKLLGISGIRKTLEKIPEIGFVIRALAIDESKNLYVMNETNYLIEVYGPKGDFLRSVDFRGNFGTNIYVDRRQNVYIFRGHVPDSIFAPDGSRLPLDKRQENVSWRKENLIGYSEYTAGAWHEYAIEKSGKMTTPALVAELRLGSKKIKTCRFPGVQMDQVAQMKGATYVDKMGAIYFFLDNRLNLAKVNFFSAASSPGRAQ